MSDQFYQYFTSNEGLQPLSDVSVDRKLARLRHRTGTDYRILETMETSRGVFRRRYRRWFQLYIPVPGRVMGKDAWMAFSNALFDGEEILNVMDGILLGIEIGRDHHREDVDTLRRENEELSKSMRELSEEHSKVRNLVERAEARSARDPFHEITLENGDRHFISHLYNPEEGQFLAILNELRSKMLSQGATANRTSVTATKVFGRTMRFDLSDGTLPLLTTKRLHLKSIVLELVWFLNGRTNVEWLQERGVSIWNEWATEKDTKDRKNKPLLAGSVGPMYGEEWRSFPAGEFFYNLTDDELDSYIENMEARQRAILDKSVALNDPYYRMEARRILTTIGIDQISQTLFLLKHRPNSRRIIVTAWNPQVVPSDELNPQENVKRRRAALAACHAMFQIVTEPLTTEERIAMVRAHYAELGTATDLQITEENVYTFLRADDERFPTHRLNLWMIQRSADHFIGVPFNIASYALLAHMLAAQANMVPGEFLWTGGDVHLYSNLLEGAEVQLIREPRPFPKIILKKVPSIFDYTLDDVELIGYEPYPAIKSAIAV